MKEKSENIAAIEKQLTAYSGDTSEESRKTIQQLKKDLADAKEDLKDTQYDKYISDTKELLDDLYSNYEKSLNDSVSDINAVLHDSIDAANNNADKISATIESAAQDVGYTVSEALSSSWDTSTGNGRSAMTTAALFMTRTRLLTRPLATNKKMHMMCTAIQIRLPSHLKMYPMSHLRLRSPKELRAKLQQSRRKILLRRPLVPLLRNIFSLYRKSTQAKRVRHN